MDKPIDFSAEALRHGVCEILATHLGLYFPPDRWPDLLRRIAAAAAELGYDNGEACLGGLLTDRLGRRELEILASHLTVGETYFFRDPEIFAALEQQLLPELIRQRRDTSRRIRIWSVGCSSGEEPYSLAMTLAGLLPEPEQWNLSVLATDINPHALARAQEGCYGSWSFRTPLPLRVQRWFLPQASGRRAVVPRIKSLVSFAYLNLMDDIYPAIETNTNAMDLVVCRNVLMYFHPHRVQQVLDRLAACVLEGGWLVLSPVENSLVSTPSLTPCRLPGVVLFRKGAAVPDAPPLPDFFLHGPASAIGIEPPAPVAATPEPPSAPIPKPAPPAAPVLPAAVPAAPEAMIRQARELANRGLLTQALACCEEAIAEDRLNPAWSFLRASVLLELGDAEAAIAVLRRCLYLDHDFVMAQFVLANLLWGRGRRKEAGKHYRNALELLAPLDPGQVLAEADGITAGRLREIIEATLDVGGGVNAIREVAK